METTSKVRRINDAAWQQAMSGTCSVKVPEGRVIRARSVKGQLQVKILGRETWTNATTVTIE